MNTPTPIADAPLRGNIKRQFEQMRERARKLEIKMGEARAEIKRLNLYLREDEVDSISELTQLRKCCDNLADDLICNGYRKTNSLGLLNYSTLPHVLAAKADNKKEQ